MKLIINVFIALLLISPVTFAKPLTKITCPDIELMTSAADKLDGVYEQDGKFLAYTTQPAFVFNNHPWVVMAGTLLEQQLAGSLEKGKEMVANVKSRMTDDAIYSDGIYYCGYDNFTVISATNSPNAIEKSFKFIK